MDVFGFLARILFPAPVIPTQVAEQKTTGEPMEIEFDWKRVFLTSGPTPSGISDRGVFAPPEDFEIKHR